jgi:hypothetical protein
LISTQAKSSSRNALVMSTATKISHRVNSVSRLLIEGIPAKNSCDHQAKDQRY